MLSSIVLNSLWILWCILNNIFKLCLLFIWFSDWRGLITFCLIPFRNLFMSLLGIEQLLNELLRNLRVFLLDLRIWNHLSLSHTCLRHLLLNYTHFKLHLSNSIIDVESRLVWKIRLASKLNIIVFFLDLRHLVKQHWLMTLRSRHCPLDSFVIENSRVQLSEV